MMKKIVQVMVFIFAGLLTGMAMMYAYISGPAEDGNIGIPLASKAIGEHFAAIIGLPAAAIGSMCIVLLLRSSRGPIKFKALGIEFHGASGPIVMWILCFLAIAAAIKLLW